MSTHSNLYIGGSIINILEEIREDTENNKSKTDKQKRIEISAIRLFSESGFSNTSTKEIARDAQVSEGIIFKYYGKKEKLLINLILPMITGIIPKLSSEVETLVTNELPERFEDFLEQLINNRINFVSENKMLFRVLIKESFYNDELREQLTPYFVENVPPLFFHVIEHYKETGKLELLSTEQILNSILTHFAGFFISRFFLFENYEVSNDDVEQIVHFIITGIGRKEV